MQRGSMRLVLASAGLLVLLQARLGQADSDCGLNSGAQPLDNDMWRSWHQRMVSQIQAQDARDAPGIDLLFYGDSLTDLWRGTVWGYSSHLGPGIPAVFSRYFGQYNSAICGAGGDTTNNLWWRIQNGELPVNHMPKVAVLMIGANDLTAAYAQCGTWDQNDYYGAGATIAQQVKGIIGTIHGAWPGTKIILLGILPRGTDYWDGGSGETAWPNVLTPAINSVNNALKGLESDDLDVTYLYCGSGFTTSSGLNMDYIQDGQHPSVAGYEALGRCISPLVQAYINNGTTSAAGAPAGATPSANGAVASFSSATGPQNAGASSVGNSGGTASSNSNGGGNGNRSSSSNTGGPGGGGPGEPGQPGGPGGGGPGGPGGGGPGGAGPGGPGPNQGTNS